MDHKISNELETAHVAGSHRSRTVVTDPYLAHPGYLMQSRESLRRGIRIGAGLDEKRCEFVVSVRSSKQECIGSIIGLRLRLRRRPCGCAPATAATPRQGFVNGGSSLKQSFYGINLSLACGKEERGKSTIRTRAQVRIARDQQTHHIRVSFGSRPHQCGLSAPAL